MTQKIETPTLYATVGGTRRHLRECPHLVGSEVVAAGDDDTRPLCVHSERELAGHGRRYFPDLDMVEALRVFGAPTGNRTLIRRHLAGVAHDRMWIVYSGAYIALGLNGRTVASAGKTYVKPTLDTVIELSGYNGAERSGAASDRSEVWGATCPTTGVHHPCSGRCDICAEM